MKKIFFALLSLSPFLVGCGDEPPCSVASQRPGFAGSEFSVPIYADNCEPVYGSDIRFGDLSADDLERIERDTADFRNLQRNY